MRTRQKDVHFFLSQQEYQKLLHRVQLSGLTVSSYLRLLLTGKIPQPLPPRYFYEMTNEISHLKEQVALLRDELARKGELPAAETLEALRLEILEQLKLIYGQVLRDLPLQLPFSDD